MTVKLSEKKLAIDLRKQGKTYNEILEVVPVAKSTLSLWLRDVGLSKAQTQRLTDRKRRAQQRGGDRRREMRLLEEEEIYSACKKDIKSLSKRELFLIGIALYWAEGAKKNAQKTSVLIDFCNSDPAMLKLFLAWLFEFGSVKSEEIVLRLHVHDSHRDEEDVLKEFWADALNLSTSHFTKSNFKKHNPKTKRSKVGSDYKGLVSIRVRSSTKLNRRILGWIYAIIATQK